MLMWEGNADQVASTIHSVPYSDNIGFLETIIKKSKNQFFQQKGKNRFLKYFVHYILLLEKWLGKWSHFLLTSGGACKS